jgi:flagellar M-ring protein FliF
MNGRQSGSDGVLKDFWQGLGRSARIGLAVSAAAIVAVTIAAGAWLLRTDYDVLFTGLSPADAAVMTAELDRLKQPYQLGGDGTSILVDRAKVHPTRLKLLGKDLPLRGAVGFELFNNSDFGMTEFAQKINYQRALQGEITRTILSLAEVETARVHLAMSDDGLFRREQSRAKASVTLGLKRNQSLRADQVSGIQRLISAAVPGVAVQDVTIVDSRGVALTRAAGPDALPDGNQRLDLKRDIEAHLARKATEVLERAFGPGRALTSIDVTLNMNQVRVTTEDVTTPPVRKGEVPSGVVVRERETIKDDSALLAGRRDAPAANAGSSHRETEYQVGRRVEQVVSQPGSIERLQVVAVVQAPLRPGQLEQLRALVGAAVGLSPQRGDVIVVQSLDGMADVAAKPPALDPESAAALMVTGRPTDAPAAPTAKTSPGGSAAQAIAALAGLLAIAAVASLALQHRRGRLRSRPTLPRGPMAGSLPAGPQEMTAEQRQLALAKVQQWLDEVPHAR